MGDASVLKLTPSHVEPTHTTGQALNSFLPASQAITGMSSRYENTGPTSMQPPRQKVERSLKEAKEARTRRRKEIERRCLALEPPIMPSTLTYMDAFHAATLISLPLDEKAWDILRPRLLSQRADAEHQELSAGLSGPLTQQVKRQHYEEEHRVAQENTDQMWLELKIPRREKLQKYAEDFIQRTWSAGRAVTVATASKFAAEVLCHVRQRFDEEIIQEDQMLALKGTAFPQDPESLACRILKLEDMKWVFEEFVKPHTDGFGKEIFLCHMCPDTNQKLFSFEAIIQHFAAKHTNTLSHGSSTVYWKADWPTAPPFDPQPNIPWVLGGLTNTSRTSGHPRKRVHNPPRNFPSSIGSVLGPVHLEGQYQQLQPQSFATSPQSMHQNSYQSYTRREQGYAERTPSATAMKPVSEGFTGSSITRSEASRHTRENDYISHCSPSVRAYRPPHSAPDQLGHPHGTVPDSHAMPYSSSGDTTRWHDHPQHLERNRESWKDGRPVSHSSMVYSYNDCSSRFSFSDSPSRLAGVRSETGQESRATSRHSFYKATGSEPGALLKDTRTSTNGVDQTATRSAMETFLASFDLNMGQANMSGVDMLRPSVFQQPVAAAASETEGSRPRQHEDWDAMSINSESHLSPQFPARHRTSLPIRQIERLPSYLNGPTAQPYQSVFPAHDRGYEPAQTTTGGQRFAECSPEQSYRVPYGGESEDMRDMVSTYSKALYAPRYIIDRDGRRYEEIREVAEERRQTRLDESSVHQQAFNGSRRLIDGRYTLEGPVSPEAYVHATRAYSTDHMENRPQQSTRPSFEHDNSNRYDDALAADPRPQMFRFDDQAIIFESVDEQMRSGAHLMGSRRREA